MWSGRVLLRKKDSDGFVFHAYAVSGIGVHDREGRYIDRIIAQINADSYASVLNSNGVEEDKPYGETPLSKEQGNKPWKKKNENRNPVRHSRHTTRRT